MRRTARVRRAHQHRRPRAGSTDRFAPMEFRFPPQPVSGRRIQRQRRASSLRSQPSRRPQRTPGASVETIQQLDDHHNQWLADPEIETRLAAYETAYRMQTSVPELIDLSDEPEHVLRLYGGTPGDGSFASNCLLARRLAEKGVRFIHLYHRGWDHHGFLERDIKRCAECTDRATYALVTDLKQRGMLEDTLVIWGGEFGRTPMVQLGRGRHRPRSSHQRIHNVARGRRSSRRSLAWCH